ncbi:hypothetical protein VW23_004215 [Devosia insulae DS-56]|uniref:Glycosyltransferase n=2 Tax=Devosia insulae TaxID=408174 RepID=A0A1E5XJ87_9HYPH|nr:hypothetical protein VW23_004215 [Devosia insulae DS-56]
MPDCDVTFLGHIEHGRYVSRLVKMMFAIPELRRLIRNADLIYASGPDLGAFAQIAALFLGKPVVIEVGDIRKIQVSRGLVGSALRALETIVANRASLLVSTTGAFMTEYYRNTLHVGTPYLVIENKLEPGIDGPEPRKTGDFTIGYFGMLRCVTSWRILEALAASMPTWNILVAGMAFQPPDIEKRIERLPNVKWLGEYKSPQDLPQLYGQVDMIWASPFPGPDESNWRWARSNRFYEACHFRKPLIVYRGSGDGNAVRTYDIGIEIGGDSIETNVREINAVSKDDIERWSRNMSEIEPSVYTLTDESTLLGESLAMIVGRAYPAGKRRPALMDTE